MVLFPVDAPAGQYEMKDAGCWQKKTIGEAPDTIQSLFPTVATVAPCRIRSAGPQRGGGLDDYFVTLDEGSIPKNSHSIPQSSHTPIHRLVDRCPNILEAEGLHTGTKGFFFR